MKKTMKKVSLTVSVTLMLLCLVLVTGSTFSLFTGKAGNDIAVNSATVSVKAEIGELALSSLGVAQDGGTFANGGGAVYENGILTISNVTPGDKVTFPIAITNGSNVDIQYKITWTVTDAEDGDDIKLSEMLVATADGEEIENGATAWTPWTTEEDKEKIVNVSVELPLEVGDDYQKHSANLNFLVEAIQYNAANLILLNNEKYNSVEEALAAANDGDTVTLYGTQQPLSINKSINLVLNDTEIDAGAQSVATEGVVAAASRSVTAHAITIGAGVNGTVTMNGTNVLVGAKNGSAIYVEEGATLNLTGDVIVAKGNSGKDYFPNAPQYSSDDAATDYEDTGASAIGGKGAINIYDVKSLTAEGYGVCGFGIGGEAASITITNTVIDFARGGFVGENDTYFDAKYLKDEPTGAAAIGTSVTGTKITLDGVTVKEAIGGSKAAGIGAKFWIGADIVIKNSTIEKVVGGNSSAAIGGSRVAQNDTAAAISITIENSSINAIGGRYGAGIGSGYDTHCSSSQPALSINISGTSENTITAVGGTYAAGIGTGYHNAQLSGSITGDVVINAASGEKWYKDAYTQAQDIGFGVVDPTREAKDNASSINYKGTEIVIPVDEIPVSVTSSNHSSVTIESNKTYKLSGDFGNANVSLVMAKGVENVVFDGTGATNINELIITQNGQLIDNANDVIGERSGKVTVKNFTVLSQINVFACKTEVEVAYNSAEALMIYAGNCDVKVHHNTIDGNFESHPTYKDAASTWNNNDYGIILNIFEYNLWFDNNTVTDAKSHAVGINGWEGTLDTGVANKIESFSNNTITVNSTTKTERAALKIWDDETYASNDGDTNAVNATAQAFIDAVLADGSNTFNIAEGCDHTVFCFYNVNTNN